MDQLSPYTIVGIILALFTVLGILKNFVKFFFNLIALALGSLAGLWAYNNGFSIAKKVAAPKKRIWQKRRTRRCPPSSVSPLSF